MVFDLVAWAIQILVTVCALLVSTIVRNGRGLGSFQWLVWGVFWHGVLVVIFDGIFLLGVLDITIYSQLRKFIGRTPILIGILGCYLLLVRRPRK